MTVRFHNHRRRDGLRNSETTVRRGCRALSGLVLGVIVSGSWLQADVCTEARDALQSRDLGTAEKLLKQCLVDNPAQLGPYLNLCGLYQSQGRTDDLVHTASEGMKRFPEEPRFYLTIGNYAGRNNQYERAIEVFGEGYRRWPQDLHFKEGLASAYLYYGMQQLDKGENEAAERQLRKAVTLAENDLDAHMNLGRALHNLNRSVEAVAEFDRVIALDPKTPLARVHRGMVRQALGDLDAAIADLTEEIRQNPTYAPSYFSRGKAYQTKGLFTEALADFDMAAQKMPDNGRAFFARGRSQLQLGQTQQAEADFRKAMALEPDNPESFNTLAQLLWRSGKKEEAESLFQQGREKAQAMRTTKPGEIRFEGSTKSVAKPATPPQTRATGAKPK